MMTIIRKETFPFFSWGFLFLFLILTACGGKTVKQADLYWPLPPEEPRIKWIGWVRGADAVKKESFAKAFLRIVVGEEERTKLLMKPNNVNMTKGRMLVSDTQAGLVAVYDFNEGKSFYLGESGAGALRKPIGVASDSKGNMYVADAVVKRVVVYTPDGKFSHVLGAMGQFERPGGIAVNNTLGRVYVVDIKAHLVDVFSMDGQFLFNFGEEGIEDGEFNLPVNIFVDQDGKVYVSDSMNFRIQIFDPDGVFLSKFGSLGDGPGSFARPKGVALDSEGHIYVVDAAFDNVQVFDNEGQLLLAFGSVGTGRGGFWLPAGMHIDENDRIYVADQYNRRINIFQYMGEKYKISQESK